MGLYDGIRANVFAGAHPASPALGGEISARVARLQQRFAGASHIKMDRAAATQVNALSRELKLTLRTARPPATPAPMFASSLATMPIPGPTYPPPPVAPVPPMAPALAAEGEVIFDATATAATEALEVEAGMAVAEAGALSGLLSILVAVLAVVAVVALVVVIIELLEQHAQPIPQPGPAGRRRPQPQPTPRQEPAEGPRLGPRREPEPTVDVAPSNPRRPDDGKRKKHHGRLQVQGQDMRNFPQSEISSSWEQDAPMTKAIALAELGRLKGMLSRSQRQGRHEAFEKAEKFIGETVATAPPKVSRSFQNKASREEKRDKVLQSMRVDVEIIYGTAFV
jgi:hypothetical protein